MHFQSTPRVCILRCCEITPVECSARDGLEKSAAATPTQYDSFCLIRTLVEKAAEKERARAAAEEWAQWSSCLGEHAPAGAKAKRDKWRRIASSRAALALINMRSPDEI